MASETCIKAPSVMQSKIQGGQSDKTPKSDPLSKDLSKHLENPPSKKTMPEAEPQNHAPKGAITFLTSKINSSLHMGNNPKQDLLPDAENKTLEFADSGKSSLCRGSTSTDVSDESSCSSLSSSVNKPHKANDLSWEAIQAVRAKDGSLDLKHFRLLKKLGCGDFGSVYLSELCGTKCYFAMKVMDKVSLAGRKKLLRAQTEREILGSLNHPFLPTLYSHFETEKLSCLVMEFCLGGDLHMLRQKQPGKHFSEQAVKWLTSS